MYNRKVSDFSQFLWLDPNDPFLIQEDQIIDDNWDLDVGLSYSFSQIDIGMAVQNVLASKHDQFLGIDRETRNPRIFTGYITGNLSLNHLITLHPSVRYTKVPEDESLVEFNTYISIANTLLLGDTLSAIEKGFDSRWRFHGGFNILDTFECLLLYHPEGDYIIASGEILLRVKLGKQEDNQNN